MHKNQIKHFQEFRKNLQIQKITQMLSVIIVKKKHYKSKCRLYFNEQKKIKILQRRRICNDPKNSKKILATFLYNCQNAIQAKYCYVANNN